MPRFSICPTCAGEGKHSRHLGSFTADEFNEAFDPEEQERYINGEFDNPCTTCNGTGKVTDQDLDTMRQRRQELYEEWCEMGRPEGSFSNWSGL
jgi:hypothetical protein